jgi:hypothetical protein
MIPSQSNSILEDSRAFAVEVSVERNSIDRASEYISQQPFAVLQRRPFKVIAVRAGSADVIRGHLRRPLGCRIFLPFLQSTHQSFSAYRLFWTGFRGGLIGRSTGGEEGSWDE